MQLKWTVYLEGLCTHSQITAVTETRYRFRKGLLCTDPTFCLKLIIEQRKECNFETQLLCIDYEKSFDSVQRQILFDVLKCRNIPDTLVKAVLGIHIQNKNQ
jgi:hypothetical protein